MTQPESKTLHIVFDGPPEHEAGRFVEVETPDGRSINAGEWRERPNGFWELVISRVVAAPLEDDFPYKEALHELVQLRGEEFAIGGGPSFKGRLAKAWRAAEELFEP